MSKRKYKARPIASVNIDAVARRLGSWCVVSIDVAKTDQFVAISDELNTVDTLFRFSHPSQTADFVSLCKQLQRGGRVVEVAMEPTGTYSDSLVHLMRNAGLPVFRVQGKYVKDCSELYDGVPSSHDAKAAGVIGWLHAGGKSSEWKDRSDDELDLAVLTSAVARHSLQFDRLRNQLEGKLARHWPALSTLTKLSNVSTLRLLIEYGSPAEVTANAEAARALMDGRGGRPVVRDRIDTVIKSAATPMGVPTRTLEREQIQRMAREALEAEPGTKPQRNGLRASPFTSFRRRWSRWSA